MRDDYHMLEHDKFFNIRMPHELHEDFLKACKVMKVKPSNFVRDSMVLLIHKAEENGDPS